jgi:hypothetical protein
MIRGTRQVFDDDSGFHGETPDSREASPVRCSLLFLQGVCQFARASGSRAPRNRHANADGRSRDARLNGEME